MGGMFRYLADAATPALPTGTRLPVQGGALSISWRGLPGPFRLDGRRAAVVNLEG